MKRTPAVEDWVAAIRELRDNPPDLEDADMPIIGRAQVAIDDALREICGGDRPVPALNDRRVNETWTECGRCAAFFHTAGGCLNHAGAA